MARVLRSALQEHHKNCVCPNFGRTNHATLIKYYNDVNVYSGQIQIIVDDHLW